MGEVELQPAALQVERVDGRHMQHIAVAPLDFRAPQGGSSLGQQGGRPCGFGDAIDDADARLDRNIAPVDLHRHGHRPQQAVSKAARVDARTLHENREPVAVEP